jgi:hypothetical protein
MSALKGFLPHSRRRGQPRVDYPAVRAHAEPSSSASASDADLVRNFGRLVDLDAEAASTASVRRTTTQPR